MGLGLFLAASSSRWPRTLRASGAVVCLQGLSAAILAAVNDATAVANQRTKAALRDALDGLGEQELSTLGLTQENALTERAEATTPDSWRSS